MKQEARSFMAEQFTKKEFRHKQSFLYNESENKLREGEDGTGTI